MAISTLCKSMFSRKHSSLPSRKALHSSPMRCAIALEDISYRRNCWSRVISFGKFKIHKSIKPLNIVICRISESMVFGALVVGRTAIFSSDYTKAKLAAFNIFKLIDSKPQRNVPASKQDYSRTDGNISVKNVHFSYPSRPDTHILNGLSFTANKGQTVALVGESGCGKSTTISLLERFYQWAHGQIVSWQMKMNIEN